MLLLILLILSQLAPRPPARLLLSPRRKLLLLLQHTPQIFLVIIETPKMATMLKLLTLNFKTSLLHPISKRYTLSLAKPFLPGS